MSICVDILTVIEEGLIYLAMNICQTKIETAYIQPYNTNWSKGYFTYQHVKPARRERYYLFSDSWQLKSGMFTFIKEMVPGRARSW